MMDGQLSIFDIKEPERPCDYHFKRYIGQKVHTRYHGVRKITEIFPYYTYLSGGLVGTPYDIWPVKEESE